MERASPGSLPIYARALNAVGSHLRRADRIAWLSFDPETLLGSARARARLDDFGDADFREPLALLARDLEDRARLTLTGRIAARRYLVDLLVNRLEMQRDRAADAAVSGREIARPVFILGLPRTGTTLLHNLIAQDARVRVPLTWEVMYPSPPPRPGVAADPRVARTARALRWLDRLAPEFKRIHPYDAMLPQECIAITTHAFASIQFHTTHDVPEYQDWLERTRPHAAYRWHRRILEQLQAHEEERRWILKAPGHLFSLDALLAVYPDACIVQTHRDPLRVVSSIASHGVVLRSAFSDAVDRRAVGIDWSTRWARALDHALRVRDADPAGAARYLDLRYAEIVRDPIGAVRAIYRHAGIDLAPAAENAMRAFLAANPQDRHGVHRHTLEQYGLDRDEESARFLAYRERFALGADG